ncbi:MAG: hypothetical protein V1725_07255 [archaeon]
MTMLEQMARAAGKTPDELNTILQGKMRDRLIVGDHDAVEAIRAQYGVQLEPGTVQAAMLTLLNRAEWIKNIERLENRTEIHLEIPDAGQLQTIYDGYIRKACNEEKRERIVGRYGIMGLFERTHVAPQTTQDTAQTIYHYCVADTALESSWALNEQLCGLENVLHVEDEPYILLQTLVALIRDSTWPGYVKESEEVLQKRGAELDKQQRQELARDKFLNHVKEGKLEQWFKHDTAGPHYDPFFAKEDLTLLEAQQIHEAYGQAIRNGTVQHLPFVQRYVGIPLEPKETDVSEGYARCLCENRFDDFAMLWDMTNVRPCITLEHEALEKMYAAMPIDINLRKLEAIVDVTGQLPPEPFVQKRFRLCLNKDDVHTLQQLIALTGMHPAEHDVKERMHYLIGCVHPGDKITRTVHDDYPLLKDIMDITGVRPDEQKVREHIDFCVRMKLNMDEYYARAHGWEQRVKTLVKMTGVPPSKELAENLYLELVRQPGLTNVKDYPAVIQDITGVPPPETYYIILAQKLG